MLLGREIQTLGGRFDLFYPNGVVPMRRRNLLYIDVASYVGIVIYIIFDWIL
jgi:hypothetical protein